MLVGVDSFADVVGQVAGLVSETTGFTTAAGTATAAAAAVTPPGNDADSVMAVAQNAASTANFITSLAAGIEQLGERAAETTTVNTTFEALSIAGGAAVAAI
jgi:conjugal transfer/entry exclusion protein